MNPKFLLTLLIALAACGEAQVIETSVLGEEPTPITKKSPPPPPKAETAPPAQKEAQEQGKSVAEARLGKVLETMKGGGYTYAKLDYCGSVAWVAGPAIELVVGQTVQMQGGMGMTDFHSKSLGRTFKTILFVNAWNPTTQVVSCAAPEIEDKAAGKSEIDVRVGIARELLEAGNYTYVRIDTCGKDTWIAGPKNPKMKVGDTVVSELGLEMQNFRSETLGRDFETLFMVQKMNPAPIPPPCMEEEKAK